jgi:hypothetical protein
VAPASVASATVRFGRFFGGAASSETWLEVVPANEPDDVSGFVFLPDCPVEDVEDADPGEPPRLGLGASFFAEGPSEDVEPEDVEFEDVEPDCPDDDPLPPESPGAADATAGVFATANPTPSITARADMQPMCFAFSMDISSTLSTPYLVHG